LRWKRNDLCREPTAMSRGTDIVLFGLDGARELQNAVLNKRNERADYTPAWWRIEESLRDYFEVPSELPPDLLTLLSKLDAVEGSYALHRFDDG
jgi:hypothetical protein